MVSTTDFEAEDQTFRLGARLRDGRIAQVVIPISHIMNWGVYVLAETVSTAFKAQRDVEALKLEWNLRFGGEPKG